jgi:chitodextrinase
MKKINLLKKFFLLITLTLSFVNVNAQQCNHSDEIDLIPTVTDANYTTGDPEGTTLNGWTWACCRHTAGSREIQLNGGVIPYKQGFISSPIFYDGCNAIRFSYATKEGKSFKVEIKQGGNTVWDKNIIPIKDEQWYEFSEDNLNIEGEFQLIISNTANGAFTDGQWLITIKDICTTTNPTSAPQCDLSDDFVESQAANYELGPISTPNGWQWWKCVHAEGSEELGLNGGGGQSIGIIRLPTLSEKCISISFYYRGTSSYVKSLRLQKRVGKVTTEIETHTIPDLYRNDGNWHKCSFENLGDIEIGAIIDIRNSTATAAADAQAVIFIKDVCIEFEDVTPPSIPAEFVATPSYSSIDLSWTASTDNREVLGYNIYANGDSIGTVADTVTTYTIRNLIPEKEYTVEVEAFDAAGNKSEKASATVSTLTPSYYATRVIEFLPAPGQFTNESIANSASGQNVLGNTSSMVSLGGFGGYIVVGFDQPIVNHPKNPYGVDFSIKGNSFAANLYGVWTEPAAVRVMKDVNGNGIPDDGEWYELAGSDYYMSSTKKNVEMTYYNPHYNVRYTVPWRTNYGETGALLSNQFHSHSYYPDPFDFDCNRDSLTYTGNVIKSTLDMSTQSYVNFYRAPVFGYCDNRGNSADLTNPQNPYFKDAKGAAADGFDISWAVDRDGNRVELDQIDFVKIYTAGNANAGWLGEWSSEVLAVGITKPDLAYEQLDYYLNYIGITQLKVLKGDTCRFEGFLFKNGIPQTEGTQVWSSSNTAVGTVDDKGLFTAVGNGETFLRFSQKNDIPTDSIRLLVIELTGVVLEMEGNSALSSDSTSLIVGETISITAQGLDNIGDVLNGSTSNRFVYDTYTWTTSDPAVGTIDNGLFTGKQTGRTMVYARSKSNSALSDSILVIVNPVPGLQLVANPVRIPYYAAVGTKKSAELFTTAVNSVVYLNSATSKNGRITPVIEKNALNYSIAGGNFGTDTLTFNVTSFGIDQDIEVAFVHEADAYATPKQLLYVDKTGSGENLKAYYPESGTTRKLIDAANPAVRDVTVDGAFAFTAAEGYVSRYNISTYEQTCRVETSGTVNDHAAVYKNLLLAAAHNASESYIAVYYKTDLTLVKQIALSGNVTDMAVVNGKLYALTTQGETSKMAIIDLATLVVEKEKSLYAEGIGVSNLVVSGSRIYGVRRHTGSAPAAVFRFDTSNETYSTFTVGGVESHFANLPSVIEPATGDSIFLVNGNGFTAYNTATKELEAGIMMSKSGLYPTGSVYDSSEGKYYAAYSDAEGRNAAGQVFNAQFAAAGSITGIEDSPATLRFSPALTLNEAPKAATNNAPATTIYEKATSVSNITINKNLFTDKENDFAVYVRDISAYSSWLNIDPAYSTNGGIRLQAKYTETIDKDSIVTVTVEAIDNYGLSAIRTFAITIKPRVYPPVVANPIAGVEAGINSEDVQIPLANVFTHTASSGVTFGKTVSGNSNAELVTASIANDTLTLSFAPDKLGEATITLLDSAKHNTYGVKYAEISFKVTVKDDVAPTAPAGLTATPAETSIVLAWTASTDNVAVTGYNIYLDGDSIDTVTETAYTITGLTSGTEYPVGVEAFDAAGNRSARASETVNTWLTGIEYPGSPAQVWYADGALHLQNLEGCKGTIYDIRGQAIAGFDVVSSGETWKQPFAKGVYILFIEKESKRNAFKFVVY